MAATVGFFLHGEESIGAGVFTDWSSYVTPGGYESHGGSVGPGGFISPQNPPVTHEDHDENWNPYVGLYGGAGAGFWFSNARCPKDLESTIKTFSINGDAFTQGFGLSLSWGNGIWQLNIQPPSVGFGLGIDIGVQRTTTTTDLGSKQ